MWKKLNGWHPIPQLNHDPQEILPDTGEVLKNGDFDRVRWFIFRDIFQSCCFQLGALLHNPARTFELRVSILCQKCLSDDQRAVHTFPTSDSGGCVRPYL